MVISKSVIAIYRVTRISFDEFSKFMPSVGVVDVCLHCPHFHVLFILLHQIASFDQMDGKQSDF